MIGHPYIRPSVVRIGIAHQQYFSHHPFERDRRGRKIYIHIGTRTDRYGIGGFSGHGNALRLTGKLSDHFVISVSGSGIQSQAFRLPANGMHLAGQQIGTHIDLLPSGSSRYAGLIHVRRTTCRAVNHFVLHIIPIFVSAPVDRYQKNGDRRDLLLNCFARRYGRPGTCSRHPHRETDTRRHPVRPCRSARHIGIVGASTCQQAEQKPKKQDKYAAFTVVHHSV